MNKCTLIYGLIDPRSNAVFYVGRTSAPLAVRLREHIRDGIRYQKGTKKSLKAQFVSELLKTGIKPRIFKITDTAQKDSAQIHLLEQSWINHFNRCYSLTNTGEASRGGTGGNARIDWNEENLSLLGTMPDLELAKMLGCDRKTVSFQRNKYGIPQCGNRVKPIPPLNGGWNKITLPQEVIDQLGTMTDTALAAKAEVTPPVIRRCRIELGIPKFQPIKPPKVAKVKQPKPSKPPKLPKLPKARKKHRQTNNPGATIKVDCPDWVIPRLGIDSDRRLSKLMGVDKCVIERFRRERGIQPFQRVPGYTTSRRVDVPEWIVDKLGTALDPVIAREAGISVHVIRHRRIELGIPTFRKSRR